MQIKIKDTKTERKQTNNRNRNYKNIKKVIKL